MEVPEAKAVGGVNIPRIFWEITEGSADQVTLKLRETRVDARAATDMTSAQWQHKMNTICIINIDRKVTVAYG